MKRHFSVLFIGLALFMVSACNQNEEFSFEGKSPTSIKVLDRKTDKLVNEVTDQKLIEKIVDELQSADKETTHNIDLPNPELTLAIYHKDEELIRVGYYKRLLHLDGGSGMYMYEGYLYEVKTPLPSSTYETEASS
ncbi:hypothetical protein [Pontibacillus marinus]|uniref:Uncharacterized protein n=1 Tax=Pontibacillus marinus BH030004 = DSM 16465 TaxID=1385511 RepID=A0A0A5GIP7_9BACI|nr:hypothetical protein [Pontibacillus marinus]KGX91899.1 hypothetical protein N783_00860 [Pontibacillus marinus BH030004 = DSM 16465]